MNFNFKINWQYVDHLLDIEKGQGGRMISTALVLFVAWVVWNLIRLRITRKINDEGASEVRRVRKLRDRFFLMRNGVVALAITMIWGSTIGGFAISVAAIAGGVLVVAKEFLLNMLGFAMFSMTRPFRLGDHIQIGATEGRVSDIGILAFEVEEIDGSHLLTGRLVSIPNGAILTTPLHKMSTGDYGMRAIEVHIDDVDQVLQAQKALHQAAMSVCSPWMEIAKERLLQRQ
jgi:small-conductance mechanosensitive channel